MPEREGRVDRTGEDRQAAMEERIAAYLYEHPETEISGYDAEEMGRDILTMVLKEFRPDLLTEPDEADKDA